MKVIEFKKFLLYACEADPLGHFVRLQARLMSAPFKLCIADHLELLLFHACL